MIIRAALPRDLEPVLALLREAALPTDGVADHFPGGFLVAAGEDGTLGGVAGVERYGAAGLLRSVAVRAGERGTGLGQSLTRAAIDRARAAGVRELFLLTTTAEGFFPRLGFTPVPRGDLPAALEASAELRGACPASAVSLRLPL